LEVSFHRFSERLKPSQGDAHNASDRSSDTRHTLHPKDLGDRCQTTVGLGCRVSGVDTAGNIGEVSDHVPN
jgi:hypothetical protein